MVAVRGPFYTQSEPSGQEIFTWESTKSRLGNAGGQIAAVSKWEFTAENADLQRWSKGSYTLELPDPLDLFQDAPGHAIHAARTVDDYVCRRAIRRQALAVQIRNHFPSIGLLQQRTHGVVF